MAKESSVLTVTPHVSRRQSSSKKEPFCQHAHRALVTYLQKCRGREPSIGYPCLDPTPVPPTSSLDDTHLLEPEPNSESTSSREARVPRDELVPITNVHLHSPSGIEGQLDLLAISEAKVLSGPYWAQKGMRTPTGCSSDDTLLLPGFHCFPERELEGATNVHSLLPPQAGARPRRKSHQSILGISGHLTFLALLACLLSCHGNSQAGNQGPRGQVCDPRQEGKLQVKPLLPQWPCPLPAAPCGPCSQPAGEALAQGVGYGELSFEDGP
ncbi:hypothetical protein CB1_001451014 [Camelus ferus]|nr:hypothetical protein CB1_001451014 [Camelus ferus]